MSSKKSKLTLSIDSSILNNAKKLSSERKIPISGLVENYLKWLSSPDLYCFTCGEKFIVDSTKVCTKCGWIICPNCKSCRCTLKEETASAIFQLRKTLENLMGGRIKE